MYNAAALSLADQEHVAIMVDTTKTQDRRSLRFDSIDDVLADVERIVAADQAAALRCTGNWTAGQTFGHLAGWINYAYEGFPLKAPWFIRLILRFMKKKYLHQGMRPGVRIPGAPEGTYAIEPMTTEAGAERLRQALRRLQSSEPATCDSPAFGKMTHQERVLLNLRHAELHLSFLHP